MIGLLCLLDAVFSEVDMMLQGTMQFLMLSAFNVPAGCGLRRASVIRLTTSSEYVII